MKGGATERVLTALALGFVLVFALLPALRLLAAAAMGVWAGNGEWLRSVTPAQVWRATTHSLEVGVVGAAIATGYGLAIATLVTLTNVRFRQWIVFAFVVQAMLPPQVIALAWLQVWLPLKGLLVALGWTSLQTAGNPLQTAWFIALLLGVHYAPLVFLTTRAGLMNIPAEVIEAARVSGAHPLRVLRRVVWPLVTPALAAGAALAFVSCIGNFGIPAFLGIPSGYLVLPTLIYRTLAGFGPDVISDAALLSVLVAMLACAGIVVQQWFARHGHFEVMPSRSAAPAFDLRGARGWTEAAVLSLIALLLVLPLGALAAKSLSSALGVPLTFASATLAHYVSVLLESDSTLRAFGNSIGMAISAAVVLAAVSVVLAYQMQVRRVRWMVRWSFIVELPYVIPGIVLAIAMILLYLKPLPLVGVSLYNSLWIIFVAYLGRFLVIQLRPVLSGFAQIPRELLEAAETCGVPFRRRLQKIVLPLLAPSVAAGAMLVVLLAMNELTVSALLWSSSAETLGVAVFNLEQAGESAEASALGVLAIALTMAVMALATWVGRRLPAGVLPWRA